MNTKMLVLFGLVSMTASMVAFADAPVFYPVAPDQPRIQFLRTINGSNFFLPANPYGNRFPGYKAPVQAETDGIAKPYGVALKDGKIFVCDAGVGVVRVFDMDKKFVTTIGAEAGAGKLGLPLNIAVDTDGTRYVADAGLGKIMVYDAKNVYVRSVGYAKDMKPSDVVISKGKLYVTDLTTSQVIAYDPKSGNELFRFATVGSGPGQLFKATNLTADADGNIIVSDTINARVSVFSGAGLYLRDIGKPGDQIGQFTRPKGVAVDRENRVYAVDAAFENVQIFDKDGKLLLPFGVAGNIPGGLNMPAKVVVDYDHAKYFKDSVAPGYTIDYVILVSSQFGDNMVNVYGFLKKL